MQNEMFTFEIDSENALRVGTWERKRHPLFSVPNSSSNSHQQIEFLLLAIIDYYCDAIIANNRAINVSSIAVKFLIICN